MFFFSIYLVNIYLDFFSRTGDIYYMELYCILHGQQQRNITRNNCKTRTYLWTNCNYTFLVEYISNTTSMNKCIYFYNFFFFLFYFECLFRQTTKLDMRKLDRSVQHKCKVSVRRLSMYYFFVSLQ